MAAEPDKPAEPEKDKGPLPAWSLRAGDADSIRIDVRWPEQVTREWAWGGAEGEGVRVCVLDSGIERRPPDGRRRRRREGRLARGGRRGRSSTTTPRATSSATAPRAPGSSACSRPKAEIWSVRVLGAGATGSGPVLLAGLRWAIDQEYDVINMSLSTTKSQFAGVLHELADSAYFRRTVLVASAHNMPVESYPWRFSSVISVGSHEEDDSPCLLLQPATRRWSSSPAA